IAGRGLRIADSTQSTINPQSTIRNPQFLHLLLAGLVVVLLFAAGPTPAWRHSGIGAGRTPTETLSTPNQLRAWAEATRGWVAWEGDGVESSIALVYAPAGYSFLVNGKSDGSARADAGTQVMLGLLGALAHPHP